MDTVEKKTYLSQMPGDFNKIKNLIANIPGVIYRCVIEHPWQMFFISDEIEKITGYPPSDFLGSSPKRQFGDLMHPDDVERVNSTTHDCIENGKQFVYEYRLIDKSGQTHYVFEKGRATYNEDGNPVFLDGAIFDITEKTMAIKELEKAKRAADDANKAKSLFLANMSHEIRTPMNAILGFADLLAKSSLESREEKFVNHIRQSGKTLLELINDVLDLSKIEAGKFNLKPDFMNMRALVNETLQMFTLLAEQKNLDIESEIDKNLPARLYLDEVRFKQVLINLLGNAIKFTESGGVSLNLIWSQEKGLKIDVKDTGIGIEDSQQSQIFEKFSQVDLDTKFTSPGTGLGLAISKQLIEMMGGDLRVSSVLNQGSTFSITIPDLQFKNQVKDEQSEDLTLDIIFEPANILVADDVAANRALVEAYLANYDLRLTMVNDGEALVELFKQSSPEKYDLILSDIKMPKLDGMDAIRKIKKHLLDKKASDKLPPTVAMTASVLASERSKILEEFNAYVAKPVKMEELIEELARHLPHKKKPMENPPKVRSNSTPDKCVVDMTFNDIVAYINELENAPGSVKTLRALGAKLEKVDTSQSLYIKDCETDLTQVIKQLKTALIQYDSQHALESLYELQKRARDD